MSPQTMGVTCYRTDHRGDMQPSQEAILANIACGIAIFIPPTLSLKGYMPIYFLHTGMRMRTLSINPRLPPDLPCQVSKSDDFALFHMHLRWAQEIHLKTCRDMERLFMALGLAMSVSLLTDCLFLRICL